MPPVSTKVLNTMYRRVQHCRLEAFVAIEIEQSLQILGSLDNLDSHTTYKVTYNSHY